METDSAGQVSLTMQVKPNVADMVAYNKVVGRKQPNRFIMLFVVFCASFLASATVAALKLETPQSAWTILIYIGFIFGGVVAVGLLFRTSLYHNIYAPDGFSLAEKTITIAPDGITIEHPLSLGTVKWPLVTEIIEGKDAVYIMIDRILGYIVPYRCLPEGTTAQDFTATVRRYRQNGTA